MWQNRAVIAVVFLLLGAALAMQFSGSAPPPAVTAPPQSRELPPSPFQLPDQTQRLDMLEADVAQIRQQLLQVEQLLAEIQQADGSATEQTDTAGDAPAGSRSRPDRALEERSSLITQRLYNLDNMIRGGIDPARAEDIVRRKNAVELRRLALQDKARREGYFDTPRYDEELAAINRDDFSLRDELGDDEYDRYLYNSRLTNRVRVNSVMLGSAAEEAGLKKNDIILSYANRRIFTWQELKQATSEGAAGEYISLSILRDGVVYELSVPRGPLGIQLGVARVEP